MSSMETINEGIEPDPETAANPAQKQAKRVFIGFAATVTIGLALGGWYLGGRIFAAEKIHAGAVGAKPLALAAPLAILEPGSGYPDEAEAIEEPVASTAAIPTAIPAASPTAIPTEPPEPVEAPPAWNTVDPQSGELYLQLAAMGPNSTNDYLKILDVKGIHPRIAPGPIDSLHRLVIGPYPDRATLEKEQKELEAAGVEFIARRY